VIRRAKPLLGTIVTIDAVAGDADEEQVFAALGKAFAVIGTIHRAMSAHSGDSDLARLADASFGERVTVSPHTCAVLRAAQHWARVSAHAFDPARAGLRLCARGARPGLANTRRDCGLLAELRFVDSSTVIVDGPLALDLGGIAKGYAVDQAVAVLREHGVRAALVNAGGDLRAFGDRVWRIDIRHASSAPLTARMLRLKEGAVATSIRGAEFVPKQHSRARWQCASVQARDCMTADALTKWALQCGDPSLRLRRTLREHGARLVRW
jgi:thiamine biosynthesis lipoprotein